MPLLHKKRAGFCCGETFGFCQILIKNVNNGTQTKNQSKLLGLSEMEAKDLLMSFFYDFELNIWLFRFKIKDFYYPNEINCLNFKNVMDKAILAQTIIRFISVTLYL